MIIKEIYGITDEELQRARAIAKRLTTPIQVHHQMSLKAYQQEIEIDNYLLGKFGVAR